MMKCFWVIFVFYFALFKCFAQPLFSSECINGGQFHYFDSVQQFEDAKVTCETQVAEGTLARVSNAEEVTLLGEFCDENGINSSNPYLGISRDSDANLGVSINDLNTSQFFSFVDNFADTSFLSVFGEGGWSSNQPNNVDGDQSCVSFQRDFTAGVEKNTFNDFKCDDQKDFFCRSSCLVEEEEELSEEEEEEEEISEEEEEESLILVYVAGGLLFLFLSLVVTLVVKKIEVAMLDKHFVFNLDAMPESNYVSTDYN